MTSQVRTQTTDNTILLLIVVAVILSFSFFAFAQSSDVEMAPFAKQAPLDVRQAKAEKPIGAIIMETSCQPLSGGDSLRKGDPGYEVCQKERGTPVPANKKVQ
jgi:hypothetical protein